jgi:hypothetical protein
MANKTKKKKTSVSTNSKKKPVRKVRGTALTIALVVIVVHSLLAAVLYFGLRTDPGVERTWILGLMVLHFLLNVLAAIGIYYWKLWGMYVYAASAIIALVAGLVSIGVWSVFYMILPVAILGWLLRSKWDNFE